MNDILRDLDHGNISVLTVLDLSATFDTIDHKVPFTIFENLYGISGTASSWCETDLTGRTQMVTIDNNSSKPPILCFSVPQGSVFGPVLFILYTKPLSNLIERHSISSQSFADDTKLLDSCHTDHLYTTVQSMRNCISEVKLWMDCNKLKLNNTNTKSIPNKPDKIMFPDSAPASVRVGNSEISIRYSYMKSRDHNLIQHNHGQACHKHLQIRLR